MTDESIIYTRLRFTTSLLILVYITVKADIAATRLHLIPDGDVVYIRGGKLLTGG